ncbi:histidine triad nucleotide-binding protein [Eubacteriales bacterium OttesenSCG-928-M02]|nr:histidine triad nucleotide-binding protein [Eubacteriales bacterium OttesenSCG-928-M02]
MADCIFCNIIAGEIPSTKIYETDRVYAFRDINPAAPVHVLIIPKAHVASLLAEGAADWGKDLLLAAKEIATELGVADNFRCVFNTGACGDVDHLHLHLLGGRDFTWPPG